MPARSLGIGLLLAGLLAACSSTQPAATARPATTPQAQTALSSTPLAVADASEGPVTASMAELKLSGERFAALGDPNAPATLVEFSDYG